MANLNYSTSDSIGHDMRLLNLDLLIGNDPVSGFNAFTVQWKGLDNFLPSLVLLGTDLVATVSGTTLTELTGTKIIQINVLEGDYFVSVSGLDVSATAFFDLVQAKDWRGLSELVRSGNDTITGTGERDLLLGGDGDDVFVAGGGRDVMKGQSGNDSMVGYGEFDVMIGGQGADKFEFAERPSVFEEKWDIIKDFRSGADQIHLEDIDFLNIGNGGFDGAPLDGQYFGLGRQAKTAEQALIYNQAKGFLYYDYDGSGSLGEPVLFAKLGAGTQLSFHDIWMV